MPRWRPRSRPPGRARRSCGPCRPLRLSGAHPRCAGVPCRARRIRATSSSSTGCSQTRRPASPTWRSSAGPTGSGAPGAGTARRSRSRAADCGSARPAVIRHRSRRVGHAPDENAAPDLVLGCVLDQVIPEGVRGPDAELSAALGLDPIADGDDHVEVVVLDAPTDGSAALGLNCEGILRSCPPPLARPRRRRSGCGCRRCGGLCRTGRPSASGSTRPCRLRSAPRHEHGHRELRRRRSRRPTPEWQPSCSCLQPTARLVRSPPAK